MMPQSNQMYTPGPSNAQANPSSFAFSPEQYQAMMFSSMMNNMFGTSFSQISKEMRT